MSRDEVDRLCQLADERGRPLRLGPMDSGPFVGDWAKLVRTVQLPRRQTPELEVLRGANPKRASSA